MDLNNHDSVDDQSLEFRQIVDCSPALIHTGRPDGYLDFFNRTWLDFTGQPLESLLGWKWISFIHPKDSEEFVQKWRDSIATSQPFKATARIRRTDGEYRWMLHHHRALRDGDGRIIKWNGSTVEIEHRKRDEEQLRWSAQELRTLIEIIPAYVGTSSPDGTVDFLSQSWFDYSGMSREQTMGWGWAGAIHPEDLDRVLSAWQAGLASGTPVEQELRCRKADGTYRWFLNRSLPLHDDDGKIVKWYGILFDIDELKKTESALQEREHELLNIIETIPSMLWSASPAGETTYLSQRILEYCGVPLEELINRGWEDVIHPDDLEKTTKAFDRSITSGESYSTLHRLRRADGEYRWFHSMGEPLRDSHGKIIQWYGLATDIDERKRAEDHLRDTRVKLIRASQIATVAELSASIAHELNQPLMSVLANAQAGRRWLAANPPNLLEINSSIERIIRDARAADEVMQHIRGLFKHEPFDKKQVSIRDVLSEAVRFLHGDPKKHDVPIDWQLDEHLPTVSVELTQIQQVFINLISNAMEALEGGQISPHIIVRACTTDQNEMLIQVIDNGPGVADQERIFDAFVTTKKNGMGIGLAVSRSIVEAHGGRLWAENNPFGGATFSVALPLSSGQSNSSSSYSGQMDSNSLNVGA